MPIKTTDKVFPLRLSTALYDFLKQNADKNKRSVNSEILLALEKYKADQEKKDDEK